MRVIFHRQVKRDLRAALAFYDAEGGSGLGDRFFSEVEATVANVTQSPRGFHYVDNGLRRAPLHALSFQFTVASLFYQDFTCQPLRRRLIP